MNLRSGLGRFLDTHPLARPVSSTVAARLKIGQRLVSVVGILFQDYWIVPAISTLARDLDPNTQEPPSGRLGRDLDTARDSVRGAA